MNLRMVNATCAKERKEGKKKGRVKVYERGNSGCEYKEESKGRVKKKVRNDMKKEKDKTKRKGDDDRVLTP